MRQNVLGHMQQGGSPSPFDRNLGTKMAAKAFKWLDEMITENSSVDKETHEEEIKATSPDTAVLLGLRTRAYQFQVFDSSIVL